MTELYQGGNYSRMSKLMKAAERLEQLRADYL